MPRASIAGVHARRLNYFTESSCIGYHRVFSNSWPTEIAGSYYVISRHYMNVLMLTFGTRGDVQPYVALGKGLSAAGHCVTICTCANFESFVTDHGLSYAYMNDDLIEFMHSDDGKIAMENTGNLWEAIRTAVRLLPKIGPMVRRQINDTWESTQAANPDLILYHPKAGGAEDFAERLGVPCMFAFYLPMYVPTGEFPAMMIPNLRLGRWYNRLTYRFIAKAAWWGTGKYINEWRKSNDLPRRRGDRRLRRARWRTNPRTTCLQRINYSATC